MRSPSGSKSPVAKRFHTTFSSFASSPETIHTSPFIVATAARPSEKKSNAEIRIHDFHGFSSGSGIVSTT